MSFLYRCPKDTTGRRCESVIETPIPVTPTKPGRNLCREKTCLNGGDCVVRNEEAVCMYGSLSSFAVVFIDFKRLFLLYNEKQDRRY